ncbi:MAG: hypothetical protein HRT89_03290 [Lentisphaeria bacterium]|nr:hypothetical protein [Lentisphaeria bacterium]NQZ67075.1 hypothetical protein [Lentisphaeria bacterium]
MQFLNNILKFGDTEDNQSGGSEAESNPTVTYCNILFYHLVNNEENSTILTKDNLPDLEFGGDCIKADEISYKAVVNRLKIVSGLNPWPSKEIVTGDKIEMITSGQLSSWQITVFPDDQQMKIERIV